MNRVKKRVLALCLATFMAVGLLGSSAFAGRLAGVNHGAEPFAEQPNQSNGYTNAYQRSDGKIYVQLGASAIITDDNTPLQPSSSDTILEYLQIEVDNSSLDEYNSYFESRMYDFKIEPVTNGYAVFLILQPKSVNQDQNFDITLRITSPAAGGSSISKYETALGNIRGTIIGDTTSPSTGDIIGFATQSSSDLDVVPKDVSVNSTITKLLTSSIFEFNGSTTTDRTLTPLKVYEAELKAEIINPSRPGLIVDVDSGISSGTPQVKMTFSTTPSVGTVYSGQVKLTSNKFQGEYIFLNYKFTITNAAISNNKITGIDVNAQLGYEQNGIWSRATHNSSTISNLDSLTVRPGDIINLEFDSDFFEWENGKPDPKAFVTRSHITSGKITVKRTGSTTNSGVIDSIEMKYDSSRAYVQVKFKTGLTTTKDQDFSFNVGLAYNGTVKSGTEVHIAGTVERDVVYVYSGDDYIDVSEGEVAEAEESISKIDVYIGEGVTITVRMTKGKQYSGSVSTEPTTGDRTVMDKYPDIELVYNLTTTNLNQTGDIVSFDVGDTYHVYDKDIKYLGTTSGKLPYSTKYFLATKQLGVDSDVQGSNNNNVVEVPTPDGTTTGTASGSGNFNPATGR